MGGVLIIEGILVLIGFGLFDTIAHGVNIVPTILGAILWGLFTFWYSFTVSEELEKALEESTIKFLLSQMIKALPFLGIPFMVYLYWVSPLLLILFSLLFLFPGIWLVVSEALRLSYVTPGQEGAVTRGEEERRAVPLIPVEAAPSQQQLPTRAPLVLRPQIINTVSRLWHHIAQHRSVLGIFLLSLVVILILWLVGIPPMFLLIGAASAFGVGYAVKKWKYKIALPTRPELRPHGETPFIVVSCFVCLGTIKKGLLIVKCEGCGKTYHETCAVRVETCPNCGKGIKEIQPTLWVPERTQLPQPQQADEYAEKSLLRLLRHRISNKFTLIMGVLILAIVLTAVMYVWVSGFTGGSGTVTPTVSFTLTKINEGTSNECYLVSISAPSRNDITISAVEIKVTKADGTTLIDRPISDIYGKKVNDAMFNDNNGDYFLNAADSFYLYTTTYSEADTLVLVYVPSGGTMVTGSLVG